MSEKVLRQGIAGCPTHLKTLAILLLLLVYYTESEVYLVGLLEAGLHLHDLGESFLGMVQGSVAIVQDADSVPELRFLRDWSQWVVDKAGSLVFTDLRVAEVNQRILVSSIGLLQIIHHEVAVSCARCVNQPHGRTETFIELFFVLSLFRGRGITNQGCPMPPRWLRRASGSD